MWTLAVEYASALAAGEDPLRVSRARPRHPLANCYQCADGEWVQLIMPRPFPGYWPRFCRVVGRDDWLDVPDLATLRTRTAELVPEVDAIFAQHGRAHWEAALDAAGLIWAPVAGLTEIAASEQVREMGWIADVDHPVHGPLRMLNTPFLIHGTQSHSLRPAPEAGADNASVLRDLGLDDTEASDLAATGVLG
jgi:crotonobetainyl-CoA:carnitine CoA-transferase CaiB-like acyl-CoA transferase